MSVMLSSLSLHSRDLGWWQTWYQTTLIKFTAQPKAPKISPSIATLSSKCSNSIEATTLQLNPWTAATESPQPLKEDKIIF